MKKEAHQPEHAEEARQENEAKYRLLFEESKDAVVITTSNGKFVDLNQSALDLFGYSGAEILRIRFRDLYVDRNDMQRFRQAMKQQGFVKDFEVKLRKKDGKVIECLLNETARRSADGDLFGYQGIIRDITEQKIKDKILSLQNRISELFLMVSDEAMYAEVLDVLLDALQSSLGLFGHIGAGGALIVPSLTGDVWDRCLMPQKKFVFPRDTWGDSIWGRAIREKKPLYSKEPSRVPEGHLAIMRNISQPIIYKGDVIGLLQVANKATDYNERDLAVMQTLADHIAPILSGRLQKEKEEKERRQAEKATELAHAELDQIVDTAPDGMVEIDKTQKILRVNRTFNHLFDIGQNEAIGKKCYEVIQGSLCNTPSCPLVRIQEGVEHFEHEAEIETPRGIKIPCIISATPFRDPDGEFIGVIENFRDITRLKRDKVELQNTLRRLRKAMRGTIQVMATMVEKRDPYTAGHQQRVADLARAIANEMGLSRDQIEGIRMAGVIHDLGKISVPAEILSKPSRLTKYEFEIIKSHPQTGYDILKTIEFPWPLAQIILQHHERLDGSGYPQRLRGDTIVIEAKILSVTDVVEAMASHRPYRPALGIEKALEEISRNRGRLYDADAVDACVTVLTEKGFSFKKDEKMMVNS